MWKLIMAGAIFATLGAAGTAAAAEIEAHDSKLQIHDVEPSLAVKRDAGIRMWKLSQFAGDFISA